MIAKSLDMRILTICTSFSIQFNFRNCVSIPAAEAEISYIFVQVYVPSCVGIKWTICAFIDQELTVIPRHHCFQLRFRNPTLCKHNLILGILHLDLFEFVCEFVMCTIYLVPLADLRGERGIPPGIQISPISRSFGKIWQHCVLLPPSPPPNQGKPRSVTRYFIKVLNKVCRISTIFKFNPCPNRRTFTELLCHMPLMYLVAFSTGYVKITGLDPFQLQPAFPQRSFLTKVIYRD